jgi:hypothetical protein
MINNNITAKNNDIASRHIDFVAEQAVLLFIFYMCIFFSIDPKYINTPVTE